MSDDTKEFIVKLICGLAPPIIGLLIYLYMEGWEIVWR